MTRTPVVDVAQAAVAVVAVVEEDAAVAEVLQVERPRTALARKLVTPIATP
jgi:hypothetical protein